MEAQMEKYTSDNDDFSLYSPKKQGQLRGEGVDYFCRTYLPVESGAT